MRIVFAKAVCGSLAILSLVSCRPATEESAPVHGGDTLSEVGSAADSAVRTIGTVVDTLRISDGQEIQLPLYDPVLHASISGADRKEWLLVSAFDCTDCDAPEQLYLIPRLGPLTASMGPYSYPGEHMEAGFDEEPLARARLFFGRCLTTSENQGVVWLQDEKAGTGEWVQSILVVVPGSGQTPTRTPWDSALAAHIARYVDEGACQELPGKNQFIL